MTTSHDERPNTRAEQERLGLVGGSRLEDYAPKYSKHFCLERRNGVLQVQMHTDGGPVVFNRFIHSAWPQLWQDIGNDPDNEVLILTGSGDQWVGGFERDAEEGPLHEMPSDAFYD